MCSAFLQVQLLSVNQSSMSASFFLGLWVKKLDTKKEQKGVPLQCSLTAKSCCRPKRKRITLSFSWEAALIWLLSLGAAAAPRKNCEGCHQALRAPRLKRAASSPDARAALPRKSHGTCASWSFNRAEHRCSAMILPRRPKTDPFKRN